MAEVANSLNGGLPVKTLHSNQMSGRRPTPNTRRRACAHLQDRHPNRIDIRDFREDRSEPFAEQQLRCHPLNRVTPLTIIRAGLISHFINNRGKLEVRQASTTLGIYQDVGLAGLFGIVTDHAVY